MLNVASIPYVQEKNKQNKLFDPTEVEDDGPLDDNASIISDQSATMSYTSDSACDSALVATTSAASSDKTTRDVEIRRLKLKLRHRNMERKAQNFSTNKVNRNKIRKIQSPQKVSSN